MNAVFKSLASGANPVAMEFMDALVVQALKEKLGVEVGETTADGKVALFEAECLGACGGAPMLICNNRYVENLTPEGVDQLLSELD